MVHNIVQIGKRVAVLFLLLVAVSSAQSLPTNLATERSEVSRRLLDAKPQSESHMYPVVAIEKISLPQLRYRLVERFGHPWFCDPDFYPVGNPTREQALAIAVFPVIREDDAAFTEIKKHLNLEKVTEFSTEQELRVYREYKMLSGAIGLTPEGDAFKFGLAIRENLRGARTNGVQITGLINGRGEIDILEKMPGVLNCPKCLASGTRIDTPTGQVPVEELKPGMMVWTVDALKRKVSMPIIAVTRLAVPLGHAMIHLRLNDGRELQVSPGHPTARGGNVAELKSGAEYDHGVIAAVNLEKYEGMETFDLLPAGATGFYWANGILLASTLR